MKQFIQGNNVTTAVCGQDGLCPYIFKQIEKKERMREEKDPEVTLRHVEKVQGRFKSRNRRNMLIESGRNLSCRKCIN